LPEDKTNSQSDTEAPKPDKQKVAYRKSAGGLKKAVAGILGTLGLASAGWLRVDHPVWAIWAAFGAALSFIWLLYLNIPHRILRTRFRRRRIKFCIAALVALIFVAATVLTRSALNPTPVSTSLRGLLIPAADQAPYNPCGPIPGNFITIYFGDSAVFTESNIISFIKPYDDAFNIRRTASGILVNATIRTSDNQVVARIHDNVFRTQSDSHFQAQSPDPHTLYVLDGDDKVVLFVRYLNPFAIKILGQFYSPGQPPITITEDKLVFRNQTYSRNCFQIPAFPFHPK